MTVVTSLVLPTVHAVSTQIQEERENIFWQIYLELFSVHLSFTIDEVQSMRLRMRIGFILINDFAERRWVGDVFFMLTLLPSIASVQPPAELTIMINAAAPLIHFVINTHIHTTLATRQYYIIINVQSRLGTRSADVCSSVDKITSSSILSSHSICLYNYIQVASSISNRVPSSEAEDSRSIIGGRVLQF